MLEKYFEYKKHKTDFKTEVIAGTTTFLTMAIVKNVVVPAITSVLKSVLCFLYSKYFSSIYPPINCKIFDSFLYYPSKLILINNFQLTSLYLCHN